MLRRNELPNFIELDWTVNPNKLLECFNDFSNSYDAISNEYGSEYFSNEYNQMTITEPESEMLYIRGKQDERCYGKLLAKFHKTYVEEILNKFKSTYTRVRLVIKKPGSYILPHMDYDTTYSVRYFIPLQTNPWSFTAIERNGIVESKNLKIGNIYFVNVGYKHSAWNFGTTDDIRLIISVNGQEDLKKVNHVNT